MQLAKCDIMVSFPISSHSYDGGNNIDKFDVFPAIHQ